MNYPSFQPPVLPTQPVTALATEASPEPVPTPRERIIPRGTPLLFHCFNRGVAETDDQEALWLLLGFLWIPVVSCLCLVWDAVTSPLRLIPRFRLLPKGFLHHILFGRSS